MSLRWLHVVVVAIVLLAEQTGNVYGNGSDKNSAKIGNLQLLYQDSPSDDPAVQAMHMILYGDHMMKMTWLNPVHYKPGDVNFDPKCIYGTDASVLNYTAVGLPYTYTAGMFNLTLNSALLDLSVLPDVYGQVYYKCGDTKYSFSEVYRFQRQRPHIQQRQRGNVALIADLGVTNSSDTLRALQQFTMSGLVQLVVHAGDISYADDFSVLEKNNSYIWVNYMSEIQPFTAQVPYMTAPGNHESQFDFAAYRNWLPMPNQTSGSNSPYWYSFDYMGIHFLSFSAEHSFNQSSPQYRFMRDDLIRANKNRASIPWIIVFGHRPLYCTSLVVEYRCVYDDPIFRSYLEDLLYEQKVDVYLCGHDHSYERTYPVYREKTLQKNYINSQAPVYIVDGEAGSPEPNDPSFLPDVEWRASFYNSTDNGLLLVQPSTVELRFQYLRSKDWKIIDVFTLTKY